MDKARFRGRFVSATSALERFLARCRFDATTGCVHWIGGKTRGRGKTAWYGSFWYQGKAWKAHRWAARFIHKLDIDGREVDHMCGDTLCVRHLQAVTGEVNRELYWIRVEVGLEPDPEPLERDSSAVPYYLPPDWLPAPPAPVEPPF